MWRHYATTAGLVVLAAVAVSAPVPKESVEQRLKRVFGEKVVPDGTSVEWDGDTLRIGVPDPPSGTPGMQTEVPKSPRTAREVKGDFTLTVKVRMPDPKDATDVNTWGGVYLMVGERDYVEYERYFEYKNAKGDVRGWGQMMANGVQKATFSNPLKPKDGPTDTAVIRLVRAGGTVTMHTDLGDGEWVGEAVANMTLPDTVTVGVYFGGRKGPHTAEFSEFTVTRAADKKSEK